MPGSTGLVHNILSKLQGKSSQSNSTATGFGRAQLYPDYLSEAEDDDLSSVAHQRSTPRSDSKGSAKRPSSSGSLHKSSSRWTHVSSIRSQTSKSSRSSRSDKQVVICEGKNTNALQISGQIFEFAEVSEV
mmetsp:Transcript_4344/g.7422  ORF Transcript_4344/g.7422 Transcript_4344/m.7422 type:complete len:131 (-) Transcript_4344:198-590(-)